MKFKKVLAGVLATSMVMTGTSAVGVGAFAAEGQNAKTKVAVEPEIITETVTEAENKTKAVEKETEVKIQTEAAVEQEADADTSVNVISNADEPDTEAAEAEEETNQETEPEEIAYEAIDSEVLASHASTNSHANRSDWNDMGAEYAFHGNYRWHQNYPNGNGEGTTASVSSSNPVWIQTGFGEEMTIGKLDYVGRGGSETGTRITDYTILVADVANGEPTASDWAVVTQGTWAADADGTSTVVFEQPVKATHIRLVATGSSSGNYVCASKINIYKVTNREGRELQNLNVSTEPEDAEGISAKLSNTAIPVGKWIEGVTPQITLTASSPKYPTFLEWQNAAGETVSTDSAYTITAGTDAYKAVFQQTGKINAVVPADTDHVRASSEKSPANGNDGPAYYAFLDNGKWWHSFYSNSDNTSGRPSESNPIWIEARFDKKTPVSEITYRSRTDDVHNDPKCCIKDYKILVADTTEAQPAADKFALVKSGQLESTQEEQTITLPVTVNATHVRIVVTSTYDNSHITASKIGFSYNAENKDQAKDVVEITDSDITQSEHGTVQLTSGRYMVNDNATAITLKAVPDRTYMFVKWTKNGEDVENGTTSQLTVNISNPSELQQYKAVFEKNSNYGVTKTYTAGEDGTITVPSEDMTFYNELEDFTVTVTGKAQAGGAAYALFTLEGTAADGTKKAFTVWYNPASNGNYGSLGYSGSDIGSGIVWSHKVAKTEAGKNFKASFSYVKLSDGYYYMLYSVNNVQESNGNGGAGYVKMTDDSWNAFGLNFLGTHDWTVENVKIGQKSANITYNVPNNQGSLADFNGTISKVAVKNGIAGDNDNVTGEQAAAALKDTNNTQTEYKTWTAALNSVAELRQKDGYIYSNDSWNAFQTALKANITETSKDWEILNAADTVKTTAAALTKRSVNVTVEAENATVTGKADSYTVGDQVSLTATAAEGYEFLYWLDTNKNVIVSTNETLEFAADADITLKAVVREKQAEQVTATFKTSSRFGAAICANLSGAAGTTVTAPTAPKYIGYTFAGWAVNGNEKNTVAAGANYELPSEDVTLVAVYTINVDEMQEKYTVTVTNEDATVTAAGKDVAGQEQEFNTVITVTAAEREGQTFESWTLSDGSVVSTNKTYSFLLKKDMELTANYTTDVVTAKPSVALVLKERTANGAKDKVRIGISWDNVEDYTIISEGMLRSYSSELGTAENLVLTNSSADIKNSKCPQVGNNGNYTVSVSISAAKVSSALYVRGYIVYKDAEGNIHTAYTDVEELASISR